MVKLSEEKYEGPRFPPTLEWWDIHRGPYKAGELLATFELLQVIYNTFYWILYHYENMPMQYTVIFKIVKNKIFGRKILIFFLFLLKT